jgi:hypothetical protein
MVAEVKFRSLGFLEPTRARLWFRHEWEGKHFRERVTGQPGESVIIMIELEADEAFEIFSRTRYPQGRELQVATYALSYRSLNSLLDLGKTGAFVLIIGLR